MSATAKDFSGKVPVFTGRDLTAFRHLRRFREALARGLTLHPDKTRIVDAAVKGGFEFPGWHFERGYRWPREKSQERFRDAIRQQTGRGDGRSLEVIMQSVNRRVRGWGNYFRGGVRYVPVKLDQRLRMRLRSILRHREKRDGRAKGCDHQRYPNAPSLPLSAVARRCL